MKPAAQAARQVERHALADAFFSRMAVYTLDEGPFARLRQNERQSFHFGPPEFFDSRTKIGNLQVNYTARHSSTFRKVKSI
jgi:hypothetical protein